MLGVLLSGKKQREMDSELKRGETDREKAKAEVDVWDEADKWKDEYDKKKIERQIETEEMCPVP